MIIKANKQILTNISKYTGIEINSLNSVYVDDEKITTPARIALEHFIDMQCRRHNSYATTYNEYSKIISIHPIEKELILEASFQTKEYSRIAAYCFSPMSCNLYYISDKHIIELSNMKLYTLYRSLHILVCIQSITNSNGSVLATKETLSIPFSPTSRDILHNSLNNFPYKTHKDKHYLS